MTYATCSFSTWLNEILALAAFLVFRYNGLSTQYVHVYFSVVPGTRISHMLIDCSSRGRTIRDGQQWRPRSNLIILYVTSLCALTLKANVLIHISSCISWYSIQGSIILGRLIGYATTSIISVLQCQLRLSAFSESDEPFFLKIPILVAAVICLGVGA